MENPEIIEEQSVSEKKPANEENQDQNTTSVEKDQVISTTEETKIEPKKEEEPSNLNVNKTNEILQSGMFF